MTTDPNTAVNAPIEAIKFSVCGDRTMSGLNLIKRNPPAEMRPACIRAETGVGVSSVSGNQV